MPYIENTNRRRDILSKGNDDPRTVGELNFNITLMCHRYLERIGVNYTNINSVIGVLDCAKMELYRQIASKYEDKKKTENGFISELDKEV